MKNISQHRINSLYFLIYCSFIVGLILYFVLALYAFKHLRHGWTFQSLFKDFRRKIAMTISLGTIFFSLYFLIIYLSADLIRQQGTDLLFLIYHHPIKFVYGGLWLFACISLSIYLVRMMIKYFYLTRGKDG